MAGRVGDEDLIGLSGGRRPCSSRYEGSVSAARGDGLRNARDLERSHEPAELIGDAGVLVDPDDVDAIERELSELLASPERREELAERGRRRAAEFTWRRCAELTAEAYRAAFRR